jgi:hypothetical protein
MATSYQTKKANGGEGYKPPAKQLPSLRGTSHNLGAVSPGICYKCHGDMQEFQQIAGPHQICGPNGFNCTTCHDPHGHIKEETRRDLCLSCHKGAPTMAWHSSIHERNGVACADCHKPPNLELTLVHVRFSDAPDACVGCHENPHSTQFGERANDCVSCHNSNKWRPSLFDHEKTAFSLQGGHENVACSACHTLQKSVSGSLVLFYKPTPRACVDCHGNKVPEASTQKGSAGRKFINPAG